jgi:hypothetical protein
LWRAAQGSETEHLDCADLGQYAASCLRDGPVTAGRLFPCVAAHLMEDCPHCQEDLWELVAVLTAELPEQRGSHP